MDYRKDILRFSNQRSPQFVSLCWLRVTDIVFLFRGIQHFAVILCINSAPIMEKIEMNNIFLIKKTAVITSLVNNLALAFTVAALPPLRTCFGSSVQWCTEASSQVTILFENASPFLLNLEGGSPYMRKGVYFLCQRIWSCRMCQMQRLD